MKLHLPKLLLTALIAAASIPVASGVDYTVTKNSENDKFHAATFSPAPTDFTGTNKWKTFSNADGNTKWKNHTLRFDANSDGDETHLLTEFDSFCIAGMYVDLASKIAGLTGDANRNDANMGSRTYYLGHADNENQAFTFNRSFEISPGSKIVLDGTQTWTIAKDSEVILKAGTLDVKGSFNLTGEGTLDVSNASIINWGSTITTKQDSTVELGTAEVRVNSVDIIVGNIKRDVQVERGGVEGNGYLTSVSNAQLFSEGSNVSTTGTVTYTLNGSEVNVENYVVKDCSGVDTAGIYLLTQDEAYDSSIMGEATKIVVQRGATLTIDENLSSAAAGYILIQGVGSTINLSNGAQLNKSVINTAGGKGKLIGSGVYDLGSITSVDYGNIAVADFEGTIKATTGTRNLNLTGFNGINSEAKLQLSGFTGYLCSSNGGTLDTNLILENSADGYALRLDNGSSSSTTTATFNGSIEGSGNMVFSWEVVNSNTPDAYATTHVFNGDTSQWKGKFVRELINSDTNSTISAGKLTEVKFTRGGDVFHVDGTGGVEDKAEVSRTSVIIDSKKDTTFNGSITNVKSVAVNSNTSFEQQVSTGALTVANSVTLGVAAGIETNALNLGTDAKLEFDGGSITIATNYEVDATCIVLAEGITFDSEEDYTLITVGTPAASEIAALSDATLTVNDWETWSGNGSVYTINNVDYTAKMALEGTSLKIKFTASIPEPTTATLSLLALAGLAARRRRR